MSLDKTIFSTTRLVFLGLLLDSDLQLVMIPKEKIEQGCELVMHMLAKKKMTLQDLQKLTGFLNFLGRAIVPGRAFTRRLYAHTSNVLMPHHHIRITNEMKLDLELWKTFLHHPTVFSHPFVDFELGVNATEMDMYSDASGNWSLGFGATCLNYWTFKQWDYDFMARYQPSIEYLELYTVTVGVFNWIYLFKNSRIVLFCDNQSVVAMINSTSSSCPHCMVLIRILVLKMLVHSVRIFAKYVSSKDNFYSDALSRLKLLLFWQLAKDNNKEFNDLPQELLEELWPMSKIWKV